MHGSTEPVLFCICVRVDLFVSLVAMTMGFDILYVKGLAKEKKSARKRDARERSFPVELKKLHNSRNILLFNSSVHSELL